MFRALAPARAAVLSVAFLACLAPAGRAQDEPQVSIATVHLADGTRIPLMEWTVSYEFLSWKQGENVQTARPTTTNVENFVIGKKTYPVKGATLAMTHAGSGMSARVTEFDITGLKVKLENPAREILAPALDKKNYYQPRSVDITGKMLSGGARSFCIASLSALVDCGTSETTRVVKIEFR